MLTGVFAVGGRGDEFNKGTSAEFIPFETSKVNYLKIFCSSVVIL